MGEQLCLGDVQMYLGGVQLYLGGVQLYLGDVQLYLGDVQLYLGDVQLYLGGVPDNSPLRPGDRLPRDGGAGPRVQHADNLPPGDGGLTARGEDRILWIFRSASFRTT